MNKLVLAETQGDNPVRSLLAALEAEFVVCPLEAIQAGERKGTTALILSESQFVALCEAASFGTANSASWFPSSAMSWSIRFRELRKL